MHAWYLSQPSQEQVVSKIKPSVKFSNWSHKIALHTAYNFTHSFVLPRRVAASSSSLMKIVAGYIECDQGQGWEDRGGVETSEEDWLFPSSQVVHFFRDFFPHWNCSAKGWGWTPFFSFNIFRKERAWPFPWLIWQQRTESVQYLNIWVWQGSSQLVSSIP